MTAHMTPPKRSNESGIALISALLLGVIGILLTIGLLTYAMGSEPLAKRHTDWNAALGAAQAGVDDYIYRLNKDPEYWRYGFEAPAPADNPALTGFTDVPGGKETDSIKPQYRYRVIARPDPATGARIVLEVTGKVGNVQRVLRASLARRGFLDYMYFTDYEQADPIISSNAELAKQVCTHWYDPNPVRVLTGTYAGKTYDRENASAASPYSSLAASSTAARLCTKIGFGGGDVITGPLHSNDWIGINSAVTFKGLVTSSAPLSTPAPRWRNYASSGTPTPSFQAAGQGSPPGPVFADPLDLPENNAKLDVIAQDGGCVYTGPTKITLNANGTMDVASPNSTQPVNPGCGTAKATTGVVATNLALPANGVIYVKSFSGSNGKMTGMPTVVNSDDYNSTYWGAQHGDVFLSGTLNGRLTIGSARDITITGDTVYNTAPDTANPNSTDMLGLIANNFVQTYHPLKCVNSSNKVVYANAWPAANMYMMSGSPGMASGVTCTNMTATPDDLTIHAAILALQHSFRVPEYHKGAKMDKLTVVGAIAQMYRGAVATSSGGTNVTGYQKDYIYDGRLAYQAPPYFLDPVTSAWRSTKWMETKANS